MTPRRTTENHCGGRTDWAEADYVGPAKPVVGVLGGMGPLATADFLAKLTGHTRVERESDHLVTAIWSNPEIPDRTLALFGRGPSPVPAMVDGVTRLVSVGAQVLAVPCNTAHAFLGEVTALTGRGFVHMMEATAEHVVVYHPGVRRVGVLSTAGTRHARLYDMALAARGLVAVHPSWDLQQQLVEPAIKAVKLGGRLAEAELMVVDAVRDLAEAGAEVAVAGCTEIPLVSGPAGSVMPVIDATDCLARAVIEVVGHHSVHVTSPQGLHES